MENLTESEEAIMVTALDTPDRKDQNVMVIAIQGKLIIISPPKNGADLFKRNSN